MELVLAKSTFATQYERFRRAVKAYSGEPFESFQTGLAAEWEYYKEYVYGEAQQRMASRTWRKSEIGTGSILGRVIEAIEIHGPEFRNNLVQWNLRYGDGSRSHLGLLNARKNKKKRTEIETLLYRFYREQSEPSQEFDQFTELLGKRYDLIAYLYFIRDWNRYMPARPTHFTKAFDRLGIPLRMGQQCSWENYSGFLARLHLVQTALIEAGVPSVRLVDAHSFCWMLVQLKPSKQARDPKATIQSLTPVAGAAPTFGPGGDDQEPDFEAKALECRRIGALAQAIVLKAEQDRLREQGHPDLAGQVRDVSDNASLGYDVASFDKKGRPKPIEVKAAARRGRSMRFFLTENERRKSTELENYTFAIVLGTETASPKIQEFVAKQLPSAALHPTTYDVRLQLPKN